MGSFLLINYLKIAYRNLIRHKSFSFINIFGLSLSLACCIFILAYISFEFSYDRYNKNFNNIYRLLSTRTINGKTTTFDGAPVPLAPVLVKDFPEAAGAARFTSTVKRAFRYKDKSYFQEGVLYTDKSVFTLFSWEMTAGDPLTALELPFTMVLTEEAAFKYFGDEDPLGKVVNWDNKFEYTVTGVVKAPPANSHFTFEVLASLSTYWKYNPRLETMWLGFNPVTYLLLNKNTDYRQLEEKFETLKEKYMGAMLKSAGMDLSLKLQPLKDIHLRPDVTGGLGTDGSIRLIYTLASIAFVILLTACFNFMNLSTARSACRVKEVGIRKVLGAKRSELITQFLGETSVLAVISLILAVLFARIILPWFNELTGRELVINYLNSPFLFLGMAGIILFTGLFAGIYPALFLSSFKPVSSVKNVLHSSRGKSVFRSILVVFQFTVSIVLFTGTITIINQHKYMQNKDVGFNRKDILVLAIQNDEVRKGIESFKNELSVLNDIKSTGSTSMVPGELYLFNNGTYPEGFSREHMVMMRNFYIDDGYFKTLEIEVVKGRGFSREIPSDISDGILINETAAKELEWNNPVGKSIDLVYQVGSGKTDIITRKVIGVYKDFHHSSLYSGILPTFIQYIRTAGAIGNRARRLVLRLDTPNLSGTIAKIEQKWKSRFPEHPFYYFFLDESYDNLHLAEAKLGSIFRASSVLAVIVGCLGLFGLASFTAEQRTREIGIRKVIGSTTGSIVVLLCKEYIYLIIAANIIAWPAAFWGMNKWLQDFPYKAETGFEVYITASLLSFIAAILAVGWRSALAAQADPVKSLRYE